MCVYQREFVVGYYYAIYTNVFQLLLSPDLQDLERLKTLVKMAANNMALIVADSGHKFAMSASTASIAPTGMLAEMFDGMQQVR